MVTEQQVKSSDTGMYRSAMMYVGRGFSVIPLRKKDKRPVIDWKEYQNRKPTEAELVSWFGGNKHNIGIVTGPVSGITVVDCDNDAAVERARFLGMDKCPSVKTGRGMHYYFEYNKSVSNCQEMKDLPDIHVRSHGGYVVAPPSIHENGTMYSWVEETDEYPVVPHWITHRPNGEKSKLTELIKGTGKGDRNVTLAKMIGHFVKYMALDECVEIALAWNGFNDPPLPDAEVKRTVASIFTREKASQQEVHENEVIRIETIRPQIDDMIKHGLRRGSSTGWDCLDEYFTVRQREWTLVTGIPGSGKTEFIDSLLVNLAGFHGWKVGIFSAENLPFERHAIALIEKYLGKTITTGSDYDKDMAFEFIHDRFFFINPEEDNFTLKRILSISERLVKQHGVKVLVIDPWNELDHRRPREFTETEHISESLSKIRRFARKHDVHIFVIAHPTKLQKGLDGKYPVPTPYDVSGSAHWRNKADNALSIWRDFEVVGKCEVHVQKIRFREVGKIGTVKFQFDIKTGRYHER